MLTFYSVIAAVICQIVYHNRIKPSSDLTFDIWPVTVCTQLIQCLSVLTTCFVYLRPFLGSLETGFIKIRDPSLRGIPGFRTEDIELQDNAAFHDPQNLSTTTTVTAEHRDWDTHSHSRILRTTTFAVEKRDYKKPLHSSPSIQFVNDHDGSSSKMPTEHTCHNEYS